jgi:hydroxyacylglutathione hydrolase
MVYSGHEYTQANARFAATIDPDNPALQARIARITAARARNLPTVPSLLSEELATNPFLRADQPDLQAALGMAGAPAADVFAHVRALKDKF